jgi:DNA-binding transcriptional regulator YiaG
MSVKGTWNVGPLLQPPGPIKVAGINEDPLPRAAIRAVRTQLGLTQSVFADKIGVSLRTVKAWEHPDPDNSEARSCTGPARQIIRILAHNPDLEVPS